MWLLPQTKSERIELIVYPDRIACVVFEPHAMPCVVKAYRMYHISLGNDRLLDNNTALQDAVSDFMTRYSVRYAALSIVLGPGMLNERLLLHAKSDASIEELIANPEEHVAYRTQYIGPQDDHYCHYVCAVSQPLMFQLGLFHLALPLHMQHIYSPLYAQIEAWKYTMGNTYGQAKLMQAIDVQAVRIHTMFSAETLNRFVSFDLFKSADPEDIVYAWGSYLGA